MSCKQSSNADPCVEARSIQRCEWYVSPGNLQAILSHNLRVFLHFSLKSGELCSSSMTFVSFFGSYCMDWRPACHYKAAEKQSCLGVFCCFKTFKTFSVTNFAWTVREGKGGCSAGTPLPPPSSCAPATLPIPSVPGSAVLPLPSLVPSNCS